MLNKIFNFSMLLRNANVCLHNIFLGDIKDKKSLKENSYKELISYLDDGLDKKSTSNWVEFSSDLLDDYCINYITNNKDKIYTNKKTSSVKDYIYYPNSLNELQDFSDTEKTILNNKRQLSIYPLKICKNRIENFYDLIEVLIKAEEFNEDFFNKYIYKSEKSWIDVILNLQLDKKHENYDIYKKAYDYLLSHSLISEKNKAAIELKLLKSFLEKDCFFSFNSKERLELGSLVSDISEIIDRGYIFKNKISSFRSLLWILSNNLITEHLNAKRLLLCFDNFSLLHALAKKQILKSLVKKRQETIILNLLSYAIDLNWLIDFEGNGEKEVFALKVLETLKLSDMLFSVEGWDICLKNKVNDNIFHIVIGSTLVDNRFIKKLKIKILNLSLIDKEKLLSHRNNKNLTALEQAILYQDEEMINFILELSNSKWESQNQSLKFLEECIMGKKYDLLPYNCDNTDKDLWYKLEKDWKSERDYVDLQGILKKENKIKKVVKI